MVETPLPKLSPYTIIEKIGEGATSIVFKCSKSGSLYAAKQLFQPSESEREVELLKGLYHKNILQFHEIINVPPNAFIITELCEGQTLFEYINSHNISITNVKRIFRKVLKALAYLHSKNVVHRDLKPENIFLTSDNIETCAVKVGDFGYGRTLGTDMTVCGTPYYMSPEMIWFLKYDQSVDIWSFGVTLYFVLAKELPFKGDSLDELKKAINSNLIYHKKLDSDVVEVMERIFVPTYQRAKADELLNMKFFRKDEEETPQIGIRIDSEIFEVEEKGAEIKKDIDLMMEIVERELFVIDIQSDIPFDFFGEFQRKCGSDIRKKHKKK